MIKEILRKKIKSLSSPKSIGYGLIAAIASLSAIATGLGLNEVQNLERQTQSAFFYWRGAIAPPKDIVILAIDDLSLRQGEFYDPKKRPFLEPFRTTTWKRVVYAQVLSTGQKNN